MHCMPNTLLPYEYDWSGFSCGYNLIKWKKELQKSKDRKTFQLTEICRKGKNLYLFWRF